jgi:hypothetical protein
VSTAVTRAEVLDPPRAALGSFLRGIIAFLDRKTLTARVRALVSPETNKLMDKPPFVFRWVASTAVDEIEAALQKIGGPELCHELGLELSRAIGGGGLRTPRSLLLAAAARNHL